MVRFDCYEVDLAGGQIYKQGVRLRLPDQSFRVLASLLDNAGQAVTREELRRRLWPGDVFVDFDNNLNTVLGRLREALNDSAEHPRSQRSSETYCVLIFIPAPSRTSRLPF